MLLGEAPCSGRVLPPCWSSGGGELAAIWIAHLFLLPRPKGTGSLTEMLCPRSPRIFSLRTRRRSENSSSSHRSRPRSVSEHVKATSHLAHLGPNPSQPNHRSPPGPLRATAVLPGWRAPAACPETARSGLRRRVRSEALAGPARHAPPAGPSPRPLLLAGGDRFSLLPQV